MPKVVTLINFDVTISYFQAQSNNHVAIRLAPPHFWHLVAIIGSSSNTLKKYQNLECSDVIAALCQ